MTMTGREHEQMRATGARLGDRFTDLAAERSKPGRQDFIDDGKGGQILVWQQHELIGMTIAVNEERAALGKPPVKRSDVEKAEQQACGHSDYARKFPWYCAEIVYGVFPLVTEPALRMARTERTDTEG